MSCLSLLEFGTPNVHQML